MSNFNKPTLKTLRDRAVSDLNTKLKNADAQLRFSILKTMATVVAGVGDEVLRRVDYLLKQLFIKTADAEFLIKHGQTRDFPRKMPTKASGFVEIKNSTPGSIVPAGTALKRIDNVTYTTLQETQVDNNGDITIRIIADNVGKEGNADTGTSFSFVTPIAGVNNSITANENGITGGSDIEDIEEYRERLLFYIQNPPTGGSKTDYETWTRTVAGVTRAWCYPVESGPGTVTVRFMMDSTYDDGIPKIDDVNRVIRYVKSQQPATATVYIEAPIPDAVDFVFSSLTPATEDAKRAIENNLKNLIQSSSIKPGCELKLSKIRAAISNATGNEDFTLQQPANDITTKVGHICVLGTITYPGE